MYYKYADLIEVLKKYKDKFEFDPDTKEKINILLNVILEAEFEYYDQLRYDAEHELYPEEREVEEE